MSNYKYFEQKLEGFLVAESTVKQVVSKEET